MRITTWNVNGLRAALRKGFADAIDTINPDVLLLQEIRATPDQLPEQWRNPKGWHAAWHPAEKLGYAGTAVLSRLPIDNITTGLARNGTQEHDPEGRVITATVAGLDIASVYLPSGSSGEHRQQEKERWMQRFRPWADHHQARDTPSLITGDLNLARTHADIYHAKSNEKSSGFLPHERDWINALIDHGWDDYIRNAWHDAEKGPFTWWSNRGRARELDRGWRIDYHLGNAAASKRVTHAAIDRELSLTISDHAPVSIDLA